MQESNRNENPTSNRGRPPQRCQITLPQHPRLASTPGTKPHTPARSYTLNRQYLRAKITPAGRAEKNSIFKNEPTKVNVFALFLGLAVPNRHHLPEKNMPQNHTKSDTDVTCPPAQPTIPKAPGTNPPVH